MIDCFLLNNENFHEKRNFIFEVKCNPVGKGRPRFARHKNFVKVYTPQKTAEFENIVRNQATILFKNQPLFETPIQVNLIAYFPIPKSFNKRQKQQALNNEIFPTKKPDIDNVAKAVLDALNGVIYKDDSLIVSTHISKLYEDAENNSKILVEICEI